MDSICRRSELTSELRWGMLKSAARTQLLGASRASQTHDALKYAIRRLDARAELATAVEAAAGRAAPATAVMPHVERLEGNLGLLVVPSCSTRSAAGQAAYADALRSDVDSLASGGARGWIVDLRGVGSSEIEPALAGLAPLLGEGIVGGWMRPDGTRSWWTVDHGRLEAHRARPVPGRKVAPTTLDSLPVAVITSRATMFEGEGLALAFRGRARTRFFGAATGGSSTAREIIRLSDGTELRFETARFVDRAGRQADGSLQPDESFEVPPAADHGDSATTAARRWLREPSPAPR